MPCWPKPAKWQRNKERRFGPWSNAGCGASWPSAGPVPRRSSCALRRTKARACKARRKARAESNCSRWLTEFVARDCHRHQHPRLRPPRRHGVSRSRCGLCGALRNRPRALGPARPCLHEFCSICTHPRIYNPPTPLTRALDQIDALGLSSRSVRPIDARAGREVAKADFLLHPDVGYHAVRCAGIRWSAARLARRRRGESCRR